MQFLTKEGYKNELNWNYTWSWGSSVQNAINIVQANWKALFRSLQILQKLLSVYILEIIKFIELNVSLLQWNEIRYSSLLHTKNHWFYLFESINKYRFQLSIFLNKTHMKNLNNECMFISGRQLKTTADTVNFLYCWDTEHING